MNSTVFNPRTSSLELVVQEPSHNPLTRFLGALSVWSARSRQRKHLSQLDDRLIKDIGVTYAEVWSEIDKPFWKK